MPLAASLVLAAACSWASPGSDRFTGDPVAAVDRYKDIPVETRAKLKARLASRKYDEVVEIRKDRVGNGQTYYPEIYDMHWGANKMCAGQADRSKWSEKAMERGLVYCEDGHCLLLPTVCGNLSRITKIPEKPIPGIPELFEPEPGEVPIPDMPKIPFGPDEWDLPETPILPPGVVVTNRVPEPSSLLLALFGLVSLVFIRRKR